MRIIVYPHSMEIGGSQLNAVEIAAGVRDLGHEVLIVAEPGQLAAKVEELGLESVPIPLSRSRPSPEVIRTLLRECRDRSIDVVHGYEWPPALEAFLGPQLRLGIPAVGTVMSAGVAPFVPRRMPLVVGTQMLRDDVLADGYQDVTLIEPPVDTDANSPDFDAGDFRQRLGLEPGRLLVVVCCRLVRELKLEGLLSACTAVGELAREGLPVQLLIAGDGDCRPEVQEAADQANSRAGERVVVLAGELADPRPAYATADVLLGMGGSALRGMAFGKPLIVQGERAYWKACRPDTVAEFLMKGWYGLGDGGDGAGRLAAELRPLLENADLRANLGIFARRLVVERFGLLSAAQEQVKIYTRASQARRSPSVTDLGRLATLLVGYKVQRKIERFRGRQDVDDFNAIRRIRAKA